MRNSSLTQGVGNNSTPPLGNCLTLEGFSLGNYLIADICASFSTCAWPPRLARNVQRSLVTRISASTACFSTLSSGMRTPYAREVQFRSRPPRSCGLIRVPLSRTWAECRSESDAGHGWESRARRPHPALVERRHDSCAERASCLSAVHRRKGRRTPLNLRRAPGALGRLRNGCCATAAEGYSTPNARLRASRVRSQRGESGLQVTFWLVKKALS